VEEISAAVADELPQPGFGARQMLVSALVKRGLERRKAEPTPLLGSDEKAFHRRHKYFTLVNDLQREIGFVDAFRGGAYMNRSRLLKSLSDLTAEVTRPPLSFNGSTAMLFMIAMLAAINLRAQCSPSAFVH
jgi:hypothetical protein